MKHELDGIQAARSCSVWGEFVLPLKKSCIPLVLSGPRGKKPDMGSGSGNTQVLFFLESVWSSALKNAEFRSADQIIPFSLLADSVGAAFWEFREAAIIDRIRSICLPVGPAHGDLHRGNILEYRHKLFVVDWSQFSSESSPVFDMIHFGLSERQYFRRRRKHWYEILGENGDIVSDVADKILGNRNQTSTLAFVYSLNRIAIEGFYWRLKGRVNQRKGGKYRKIITSMLDAPL